ncbi:MAG: DUF72 domain-containing protein [Parachlamydiaceae bacterium]|nr:DUF72 domain-containing protein [Parachlamydiaceae bacterium]
MKKKHTIHIGTSGWSYEHWKEKFFPTDLKQIQWLPYYANTFSTVEVNTTFYHTPRETTVLNWYNIVPKDFIFSVKMNRYITHNKKLSDCQDSLGIFYQSIQPFEKKMGPILIQLPPKFNANKERLNEFIHLLNKKHRYTFEFRNETWFTPEIYEVLKENNIALCITDLRGELSPEIMTSDFVYIRLHGPKQAYGGSYGPKKLKEWKKKIENWLDDASVYCYFDNDEKGYAIQDALVLQKMFKGDDE